MPRIQTARRMERIRPFYVMELLAEAQRLERQGLSIIHMEVGEPDFDTPAPIVAAGQQAIAEGKTHYTPAIGLPELREAISRHYAERHSVQVPPERIIVTPGSSGALQLAMAALIDPGDQVLLADPGYPCNRHLVHLMGGEPLAVAVDATTRYQLTAARVAQAWTTNTKAVMVATPSNPTGTLLTCDELRALHGVVTERGGVLIVDEIYQGLIYDGNSRSAVGLGEDLIVINSFSKFYGMTGWRLGWMVVPAELVDPLNRLAQNLFLAPPTMAQWAALAAFTPDTSAILEQRRRLLFQRREFLLPALSELGFHFPVAPQGAFYLYGDCSRITDHSFNFAQRLLAEAGVAVTPGRDFGNNLPEKHLRFAYTTDIERLREGVERIRGFLQGR